MHAPWIGHTATVAVSPDGANWTAITDDIQAGTQALALTSSKTPVKYSREQRHTVSRHIRAVRLRRARAIARTIPTDLPLKQYLQSRRYVAKAVSMFGRRTLARVVWPWLPRQKDAGRGMPCPGRARRAALAHARQVGTRTPRGRLANPTVLA